MRHHEKFLLLLAVSFALIGALALATSEPDLPAEQAQSPLPKVFDFRHFKETFKRRYESFAEQLARQKIFLAHAVKAFVSLINFKHKRSSSYQAINQFSDWTAEEKHRLALNARQAALIRKLAEGAAQDETTVSSEPHHEEATLVISERELREELEVIAQRARSEPEFKSIANELNAADGLLRIPTSPEEPGVRVKSNNPDYQAPELPSCSSADEETRGGQRNIMTEQEAQVINDTPSSGYLSSMLQSLENIFIPAKFELKESNAQEGGSNLPNLVKIDHRKSHCFFEPRDQGNCGSCYAFSTIALYEWHHCNQTGKKAAFSEQYIVDCGPRMLGTDYLEGCSGGLPTYVSNFVNLSGLELRRDYPYREKEDVCPYEDTTANETMGYLRVQDHGFKGVNIRFAEEALKNQPMIITIAFFDAFYDYGGGVLMGEGCHEDSLHAVLLVGSGRQDGLDYWLIRNSWSTTWGERGYFKLYKYSGCITPTYAYKLNVEFPDQLDSNPSYDPTAVKQRLEEYKKIKKAEEDSKQPLKHRRRNRKKISQEMIDNL